MSPYADNPIGTIADCTAAGAFCGILAGWVVTRRLDDLDAWVSVGVLFGGVMGVLLTLSDHLS